MRDKDLIQICKEHDVSTDEGKYDSLRENSKHNSLFRKPEAIAEYVKLLFNILIMSFLFFLVIKFLIMIRNDVNYKLELQSLHNIQRIKQCQKDYERNNCHANNVVPALQERCILWYNCFNNLDAEAKIDGHSAKMWAQTIAEVVNAFVDAITLRSLLFLLFTICSVIIVTNVAFGSYKVYYYNESSSASNMN